MVIIDKTKPQPWIYLRKPKPQNMTPKEKSLYWGKEKEYMIEGYNGPDVCNPLSDKGIPGTYYFLVQHALIHQRLTGKTIVPEARLGSLMLHTAFHENKKKNKHTGVIKGRGFGLSAEGGVLADYHAILNPGATCLMTSKEKKAIAQLFMNKVYFPYTRLDSDLVSYKKKIGGKEQLSNEHARIQEISKNNTASESYLRLGITYMDPVTKMEEYGESQILCLETTQTPSSATAFSGTGAIFGFYDELPLHKRKKALLHSSKECYRDSDTGDFAGFLLWGGTCEDELTPEDLLAFKELVEDKDIIDTEILFIPYTMSKYTVNGHPDVARAEQWWNSEYEKYSKDKTGDALRKFIKNHPRTMDDIWDIASGNHFSEATIDAIKRQQDVMKTLIIPETPVTFVRGADGMVHSEIKLGSATTITEMPKPNIEYVCLIDGTSTGSVYGSTEGSELSAQIVKTYDPEGRCYDVVCEYLERPKKLDAAFKHIILMCDFYAQRSGRFDGVEAEAAQGMAEWMCTYLINAGKEHWITRSNDLSGKKFTDRTKAFQAINDKTKDFQYNMADQFFEKHVHGLTRKSVLNQLLEPREKDGVCHSRSAYLLLFCKYPFINQPPKSKMILKKTAVNEIRPDGTFVTKIVTTSSSEGSIRGSQRLKYS